MGSQRAGRNLTTQKSPSSSNTRKDWRTVISSVAQSCLTLCDPMNRSMPGLSVHHQLLEFTQTHVHWVGDAIQLSDPLSSPSPPAPNPSHHQGLFQWVNSLYEVANVLEFQLQHQSFQWTPKTDLLAVQGTLKSLLQHHSSEASRTVTDRRKLRKQSN